MDDKERFMNFEFTPSWVEVEAKPMKKDLPTLIAEKELLKNELFEIQQKQDRLANLSKFYKQSLS